MPNLASLYGAMLAGVDYVLMGAGIPREIPGALDALSRHEPASLKLDVERDVPIHGRVLPIAEVHAKLAEQTRNAEQLCAKVESVNLSMPGCPLAWND